jgi:flagella basal body P-ring formation protein FlgA
MAFALLVLGSAAVPAQPPAPLGVLDAIAEAAVRQLGAGAVVSVTVNSHRITGGRVDGAVPEPGARLGRPARFRLLDGSTVVGNAVATLTGIVPHLKATAAVPSGEPLRASQLSFVVGNPGQVALAPLPTLVEAVGSTARRRLAPGETVVGTVLRRRPAVRSGQVVEAVLVAGELEVRLSATALQSGHVGETILLVNRESRRQLRGRIVTADRIEVVHGS